MSESPQAGGPRLSVEEMYADHPLYEGLHDDLDISLGPRGPDVLFEMAGELGVTSDSDVLDVGCRDGRHVLELHRRFGCPVTGVELVADNLARANRAVREAPVNLVRGSATALPLTAGSFDLVWVRDVLIHIEDVAAALAECRRVLRAGAAVLVYQMFATPWLELGEAERLWPPLAAVAQNTNRAAFEAAIARAGLRIERRDELRSEWREYLEEHEDGRTSRQLLWAARLIRRPVHYQEAFGAAAYHVELANSLWGVYQMIGKLSPAIYVLRSAAAARA